jgi:hypothetical protein
MRTVGSGSPGEPPSSSENADNLSGEIMKARTFLSAVAVALALAGAVSVVAAPAASASTGSASRDGGNRWT